jgi:signal peptidase I
MHHHPPFVCVLLAASTFCQESNAFASKPGTSFRNERIHAIGQTTVALFSASKDDDIIIPSSLSTFISNTRTAASEGFGTRARNVGPTMMINDLVVPICSNLERRQSLAQIGLYAGVEYIICDIREGTGTEGERLLHERMVTLKPAYPLRSYLERSDWPVTLAVTDVPLWLSKATYEAGTALGTLLLAGTYLTIALVLSTVLRIVNVPSESMEPALMPGDVVLVTRSIFTRPKVNDVVFFNPPRELDDAIANSKVGRVAAAEKITITSTKGKQFLKRVVGVPGDTVGVWNSNPYIKLQCKDVDSTDCTYRIDNTGAYSRPDLFSDESWNRIMPTINTGDAASDSSIVQTLAKGEYFVAGDNGFRSIDSRVWGPLKQQYIFGTANWIIYPMTHFGPISPGPFSVENSLTEITTNNL